jgi:hypothetical protein
MDDHPLSAVLGSLFYIYAPNDVVQWLKFLTLIREIPGSNLGLMTSNAD